MIGLSVSLCVKDVIEGKMAIGDVEKIISRTACETTDAWDEVIARYKARFWHHAPEKAETIIRRLIADGKVSQPRLAADEKMPDLHAVGGHWVKSEEEVIYEPYSNF